MSNFKTSLNPVSNSEKRGGKLQVMIRFQLFSRDGMNTGLLGYKQIANKLQHTY